jgi:hypothetical protein
MTRCNIALPYDPSTGHKILTITGPIETIDCAIPLDCDIEVMVSCMYEVALNLQSIACASYKAAIAEATNTETKE